MTSDSALRERRSSAHVGLEMRALWSSARGSTGARGPFRSAVADGLTQRLIDMLDQFRDAITGDVRHRDPIDSLRFQRKIRKSSTSITHWSRVDLAAWTTRVLLGAPSANFLAHPP
jgi:hypothetical protein